MGRFGRWRASVGAADRRRTWRLRLTATGLIAVLTACLLVVVMPSLAKVRPSVAASRSAPDLGLTKATALQARAGRTYTVTLAGKKSQRWLVVRDPYDPSEPCSGRCPNSNAGPASALVGATVQSRGGACVARASLEAPTITDSGNIADRRRAGGLVASGTTFMAVAVASWSGRVYLGLNPDSSFRCSHARYAVRLTVQRALATATDAAAGSASAAQYESSVTTLERRQSICFQKGEALDRYTGSLTAQIIADGRRHGLRGRIAKLKAAINAANRRYTATPCPPR